VSLLPPLPFTLPVPGRDKVDLTGAYSTAFKFHGFVYLEEDGLRLEWSGVAQVDEVGLLSVEEREVPLPEEELFVPFEGLREVRMRGFGPWRSLELVEARLGVLRMVPGELRGRLRLRIARRDRPRAEALVREFVGRMGEASPA
jgi:hypothetical protein